MKNSRQIFLVLLLFGCVTAYSQIQNGYVKTLGRAEKKGEALGGVSVKVKGEHNPVLSKGDGSFSIMLPNKKNGDAYVLQEVRKNGYELNEAGVIGRQYALSDKVKLTIVMVSIAQLEADIQRIEENIYRVAESNYKVKLELLNKQIHENSISAEKYQSELQALQNSLENYQSMIEGLAKHYAHVDYDELDENERTINMCIENGELERADSLIRISFNSIDVLKRNKEAIAQLNQQISQANTVIEKANKEMAAVLKQQEKDAEHLFQLYIIALSQFDNHKAEQYIRTRAELDSTNLEWQFDAAYYYENQNQYRQSEYYYSRALSVCQLYSDNEIETATTLNNLANLYSKTQRFAEADSMYKEALAVYQHQMQDSILSSKADVALTLHNMAMSYSDAGRFIESESLYNRSLDIFRELAKTDPLKYNKYLAKALNNLAALYEVLERYQESEQLYLEALSIRRQLSNSNSRVYDIQQAQTLNNLGNLYANLQRFSESEQMYIESVDLYRKWANRSPQMVEPDLATVLNNLASLYTDLKRYSEGESLFQEALVIRERLAQDNPRVFEPNLAATLFNLATLYRKNKDFQNSEQMYRDALELYKRLVQLNEQAYTPYVAKIEYYLGLILLNNEQTAEAIAFFNDALQIYREQAQASQSYNSDYVHALTWLNGAYSSTNNYLGDYETNAELLPYIKEICLSDVELSSEYADRAGNQSNNCIMLGKFAEAEQYAQEGLSVDPQKHWIISNLAASQLFQGKISKARKLYKQHMKELGSQFIEDLNQYTDAGIVPKEREADVKKIIIMLENRDS